MGQNSTARKIAHDLRNSINVAMLAAGALVRRNPEEERRASSRQLSETVERSLTRATLLIQDLLDVTETPAESDSAPEAPDSISSRSASVKGATVRF